jgi:hypothetical protein
MQDPITIEEFEGIRRDRHAGHPSLALLQVRPIPVGGAAIIEHGELKCRTKQSCVLMQALSRESRLRSGVHYSGVHLEDGKVAVACYER